MVEGEPNSITVKVEGQSFKITSEMAKHITLFEDLLEQDSSEELDLTEIAGTPIKKSQMEKLMIFCDYIIKNTPPQIQKPIRHQSLLDITSPWYTEFASQFDDNDLCEMMMVADRLYCKSLLELLSARMCLKIKDMNVPEIRKFFDVEDDYTEEERNEIKEQNEQAKEIYDIKD